MCCAIYSHNKVYSICATFVFYTLINQHVSFTFLVVFPFPHTSVLLNYSVSVFLLQAYWSIILLRHIDPQLWSLGVPVWSTSPENKVQNHAPYSIGVSQLNISSKIEILTCSYHSQLQYSTRTVYHAIPNFGRKTFWWIQNSTKILHVVQFLAYLIEYDKSVYQNIVQQILCWICQNFIPLNFFNIVWY